MITTIQSCSASKIKESPIATTWPLSGLVFPSNSKLGTKSTAIIINSKFHGIIYQRVVIGLI